MLAIEPQSATLRGLVRTVTERLSADNLRVADMSRASSLELDPTIMLGQPGEDRATGDIRRLEGQIEARPVPRHTDESPIRYFLDGSQKTLPVWRVGTMPVIASVTAAAILQRATPSAVSIVPETLVARVHWIVPRYTDHPTLNRIANLLESMGQAVEDPLDAIHRDDPQTYRQMITNYTHVLEQSFETASNLRARIEADLLRYWQQQVSPRDKDGWIVVDGRLRTDIANAIGLVKNAQAQHLQGDEAVALYDLGAGQRTSAYVLVEGEQQQNADQAMWYLRMQNASGQDARHGLIRLETPAILTDPELIDLLSSWILSERAPRASSDSRWATLLYPIHLLERMLKRRIQTITAGWPA